MNNTWYCFGWSCSSSSDVDQGHAQRFFNDTGTMGEFHTADNGKLQQVVVKSLIFH